MNGFQNAEQINEDLEKEDLKSPGARFCTNCGTRLEDGDLFCVECGAKVEKETEEISSINVEKNNSVEAKNLLLKIPQDRLNAILEGREERKSNFTDEIRKFSGEDIISYAELLRRSKWEVSTLSNNQKCIKSSKDKNKQLLGYYVHKDSEMSEYIVIKNIDGNQVSGIVLDRFTDGAYGNETFTGTLIGDSLELQIISADLHPCAKISRTYLKDNQVIKQTVTQIIIENIEFSGILTEEKIAGTWKRKNGKSVFLSYTKC